MVIFVVPEGRPCLPSGEEELPGGARRLVQKAEGIHATVVNGCVTFKDGASTGIFPGAMIKGRLANGV